MTLLTPLCQLSLIPHRAQNAAPSWLLENPTGAHLRSPWEGDRAFWGCDPSYRNKAPSASGEEREGEGRLQFSRYDGPSN